MWVSVLGAGAWGTAVAVCAAERHSVHLWARDAGQAAAMREARRNDRYLPGVRLADRLAIGADLAAALRHANRPDGLVVIATPMAALAATLTALPETFPAPVVWLCKGFEQGTGRLGHEIAGALRPGLRAGVVSGPSFALEVARRQPTALVAASLDASVADAAVQALHGDALRVYSSSDPVGVEVGGAVKNVLALATGIADGMARPRTPFLAATPGDPDDADAREALRGLGMNARAALITRGLAEMTRLGVALGARADTFMGLSGLGDLVLTATGTLSRNRSVGIRLAEGLPLARILAELGHVAEGVSTAPTALARARAMGVEMPITEAVVAVLEGRVSPAQALERLMGREARPETL